MDGHIGPLVVPMIHPTPTVLGERPSPCVNAGVVRMAIK